MSATCAEGYHGDIVGVAVIVILVIVIIVVDCVVTLLVVVDCLLLIVCCWLFVDYLLLIAFALLRFNIKNSSVHGVTPAFPS